MLLAKGRGIRILRIVSTGQADPSDRWQNPEDDEWVVLLSGSAGLLFEEGHRRYTMKPGDWCHIPAGTRHRVEFTDPDDPSVWIAVHFDG
ncbi:MAG: cupin domain-containing protein [Alphaproteobacteria bacterium]